MNTSAFSILSKLGLLTRLKFGIAVFLFAKSFGKQKTLSTKIGKNQRKKFNSKHKHK